MTVVLLECGHKRQLPAGALEPLKSTGEPPREIYCIHCGSNYSYRVLPTKSWILKVQTKERPYYVDNVHLHRSGGTLFLFGSNEFFKVKASDVAGIELEEIT